MFLWCFCARYVFGHFSSERRHRPRRHQSEASICLKTTTIIPWKWNMISLMAVKIYYNQYNIQVVISISVCLCSSVSPLPFEHDKMSKPSCNSKDYWRKKGCVQADPGKLGLKCIKSNYDFLKDRYIDRGW